ncbi:hypothetical protein Goshw_001512 [Gossypium schwendimanii]|uniref:RNase H type-1 domain-containing protein n=1 Tax=Gossypium schwendimanii TaxID=34291 RepID=A0A7J9NGH6_GOSSC|nr:hypothetical protein [Gossypium schwendimanii]
MVLKLSNAEDMFMSLFRLIAWILRYIPREYNQVADCLAKQALMEKPNL